MTPPLPLPVDESVLCPRCGARLAGPWVTWCSTGMHYTEDQPRAEATARKLTAVLPPREEEDIRLGIRGVLELHQYVVLDFEQGYRKDGSSRVRRGVADLYVMGFGRSAWVEVKRADGKTTAEQDMFGDDCDRCGILYFVWRSEDEALEWCRNGVVE